MNKVSSLTNFFVFVCLCTFTSMTLAQTRENKIITGVDATFLDYKGVVQKQFFSPSNFNIGLRLAANIYLSEWLNYTITSSFIPQASYPQAFDSGYSPQLLMDFNTGFQFKTNNGWLFKEDARFAPYIFTGIGLNTSEGKNALYAPIALGFRTRLTSTLSLNIESMYRQKFGETLQPRSHSLGLVFVLPTNKTKSSPANVLNNKKKGKGEELIAEDLSTEKKAPVITSKPSSHDGDPLPQKINKPKVENAQIAAANTKPKATINLSDKDRDGIPDAKDGCPDEYGSVAEGGCPQATKIKNENNISPKIEVASNARLAIDANNKDTDGDGIWDRVDGCPLVAGLVKDGGCAPHYLVPHAVVNKIDNNDDLVEKSVEKSEEKIERANINEERGQKIINTTFSELNKKDIDRLATIAINIKFVPGTDSLTAESKPFVTELNNLLIKYGNYRLEVNGYYTGAKDEEANQVMSVLRAHRIKKSLLLDHEQKYIRVKTNGLGSNNTEKGVNKNRLELKLIPI